MSKILRRNKWRIIIAFLAPAVILYGLFIVYPYIRGIQVSFFKWSGLSPNMTFKGIDNYIRLFGDKEVFKAITGDSPTFTGTGTVSGF